MNINTALNRTAFFLIAVLLIMIALSAVIPQREIASGQIVDWQEILGDKHKAIEQLGLDRIYYTPAFFIILALLGPTLLYGNIRRFQTIFTSKSGLLRARHLGSIIFHLSLLIIIAGIILNFLYKYEGELALTEGQQVLDRPPEYFREFKGPLHEGEYENFAIRLDTLRRTADLTDPGGIAFITLHPSGETPLTSQISINHPYEWKDIEFHIGQKIGYSPEIQVLNREDSTVFRAFMRVAVFSENGREINRDFIQIPGRDIRLEIEVIAPDTASPTHRYYVLLQRDSAMIQEATLTPGDTADFGDVKISIPRLRNWCYIGVVKSPYLGVVFFGFWIALSGMALGFVSRIISTDGKS